MVPKILVDLVTQTLTSRCHEKYGNQRKLTKNNFLIILKLPLHPGTKLDPSEAQCKSYSEYAFCIQNCIADMVDSEVNPAFNLLNLLGGFRLKLYVCLYFF